MMTEKTLGVEPTKILWTGGWDSTFQLLQLVFIQNRSVIPFYLIDEPRQSTGMELFAMEKIRRNIRKIDQKIAKLIGPTQIHFVAEIAKQSSITKLILLLISDLL